MYRYNFGCTPWCKMIPHWHRPCSDKHTAREKVVLGTVLQTHLRGEHHQTIFLFKKSKNNSEIQNI